MKDGEYRMFGSDEEADAYELGLKDGTAQLEGRYKSMFEGAESEYKEKIADLTADNQRLRNWVTEAERIISLCHNPMTSMRLLKNANELLTPPTGGK